MKNYTFLMVFLLFVYSEILGQKYYINQATLQTADTLWQRGEKVQDSPEKIKLMFQFADSLKEESGQAMRFIMKALELSQTFKQRAFKGEAHLQVGKLSFGQQKEYLSNTRGYGRRDFKVAKENILQALMIAQKIKDIPLQIRALNEMGVLLDEDLKLREALDTFFLAKSLALSFKDRNLIVQVNKNTALLYRDLDSCDSALALYKENQALGISHNDKALVANALHDMGHCFLMRQALITITKNGNYSSSEEDTILQKQYYNKALDYFFQSLPLERQLNDGLSLGLLLKDIGQGYMNLKNYEEAYKYSLESLNIAKKSNNYAEIISLNNTLASICLSKKNYDEGIKFAKARPKSYSTTQKEINENTQLLSALYEAKGEYKNAWLVQKEAIEHENMFSDLRGNYRVKQYFFNKKNTEQNTVIQLQKNNTQWKNVIALLSLIFLGVIGFTLFKNRQKKQTIRLYKEQELEKKVLELNLRALQAQMAPHFAFNCLNALKSLILDEKSKEARIFMTDFSKLLREIFDNFKQDYIPLTQEIDFLKHYISIEQNRFNNSFTYQVNVEEEQLLDDTQWSIPPMLIQPIVENAIKYGMAAQSDTKNNLIVVFVSITEGVLKVCVEDNGASGKQGIDMGELTGKWATKNGRLSATQITYERLNLLRGRLDYAKKESGGTIATLFIPLKY